MQNIGEAVIGMENYDKKHSSIRKCCNNSLARIFTGTSLLYDIIFHDIVYN